MVFDRNEEKVVEHLLDIGYYRLGFYWNPFEIDKVHTLKSGTRFSDVIQLYYFDVDLRHLLLRYTSRIEVNFRTKVVYYVSNTHKDSSIWFANKGVLKSYFVNNLSKFYNDTFIRNNKPIKDHHLNYPNDKYAPAWKTLEYFTFGTIQSIYKTLKTKASRNKLQAISAFQV